MVTFMSNAIQITFPEKLFFCRAKLALSSGNGSFKSIVVPPTLLAAEKEEAKSVLSLFLKKQGLSKVVAAKTIIKSDLLIDHLLSRLHFVHKSQYLKKPKAVSRMIEVGAVCDLCPQFLYLLELGMDLEQIKLATRGYPSFANYSLERKIKPLVEFLLDLGVAKSDIPKILVQEDMGVDKDQWAKVIYRFPGLLNYSRQKVQATVEFLYESGLSSKSIGKILTRWPKIVSCSVEQNL
ncbi:hypothetical protein Pint_26844 [Pistacia integerrima]|uniref:Uncharacterized protein n=1 Tax=Pistacia integerrima TaxID=434235 RepID=A0ACC0YPT7_9ROSI|nr:hypothetical protein Pint_26844 [Pistacia integerrima]